jgi:hypothetical protein
LGAEIGELMHSAEKNGGNSLGRSSPTQRCSMNGRKRNILLFKTNVPGNNDNNAVYNLNKKLLTSS